MPPLRGRSFPNSSGGARSFHFRRSLCGRSLAFAYPPPSSSSSWNDDLMAVRRACRIKRDISSSSSSSRSRRSFGDSDYEIGKPTMNKFESELSFDGYCTSRGLSLKNLEESESLGLEMLWNEVNGAKAKFRCKQSELDAKICLLIGRA